jgi:ribosomal protein S3
MGQKVNPIGYRLALNRDWRSRWFASPKELPDFLHSDLKIRAYVKDKLRLAAVSKIVIERAWNSIRVTIFTARPGIVIGRKGTEIEKMTEEIGKMSGGKSVKIDIQEIKTPELDAQLVAENVALQMERRISFRRAMKKALQTTMDFGADGIKIAALAASAVLRSAVRNGIAKGRFRFRRSAPPSTTASLKPAQLTASSASNAGSARSQKPSSSRLRRRLPSRPLLNQ